MNVLQRFLKKPEILVAEASFTLKGRVQWRAYKAGSVKRTAEGYVGELVGESEPNSNLVMFGTNTGRDLILKRLGGTNTYSLNILYADIGTGAVAPTIANTQLGAAVARASNPVILQTSNLLSFQFFWANANLANGSYTEIGTFVDGTASVNTGQIFNRALFASTYVKGSNTDTTVQVDFILT